MALYVDYKTDRSGKIGKYTSPPGTLDGPMFHSFYYNLYPHGAPLLAKRNCGRYKQREKLFPGLRLRSLMVAQSLSRHRM
jgi:hypothetical protein